MLPCSSHFLFLALRRLRLYHKTFVLSIPFLKFFQFFSKYFLTTILLPFSLCIISLNFKNCNTFSKIFSSFFIYFFIDFISLLCYNIKVDFSYYNLMFSLLGEMFKIYYNYFGVWLSLRMSFQEHEPWRCAIG